MYPIIRGTLARSVVPSAAEYRARTPLPLSLVDAIRKMSYMPALRLERSTPQARKKGRLQVGADADLVILDPQTFRDQSTFEKPAVPSTGVRHPTVNGTVVIDGGAIVPGVAPGLRSRRFYGTDD